MEQRVVRGRSCSAPASARIDLETVRAGNGFTPRVQRLKDVFLSARPTVASDRAWYMLESFRRTEGEHPAIRRGKAVANVFDQMPITIREDELIVGAPTPFVRGAHPCVELAPEHLEVLVDQHEPPSTGSPATKAELLPRDKERLLEAIRYWKPDYPAKRSYQVMEEFEGGLLRRFCNARMSMAYAPTPLLLTPGADYDKILAIGFQGHIAEARAHIERIRDAAGDRLSEEDQDKIAFLESVILALEGAIRFAHRHAALAREMAARETNEERKRELLEIAEVCEWVPANPPRSFREAMQMYWFVCAGHDIEKAQSNAYVGRFDQYMWPFYDRDIREGRITRQQAAELLGCLFVKWASLEPFLFMGLMGDRHHQEIAQANYFANVTIGGVTRNGRDASNELSCLFLHVCSQVKTHQPHVTLRWHRAMAPELLDSAIECNRIHGAGIPAWFNDRVGIEYLLDRGASWEDARDWALAGCVNTSYPKSFAWVRGAVVPFVNHAKILELALHNGVDPYSGERLGIETGDPRSFQTFEQVLDAYKAQLAHYYDFSYRLYRELERPYYEDAAYFPFCSAFLQDCIAAGKDATRGGGRYPQLEAAVVVDRAVQDAADSLTALRKVVFEDRAATMDEVLDALKSNFAGYEDLRRQLLDAPKFGNDDPYADDLVVELWENSVRGTQGYRDGQGRRFTMFRQGAAWATWAGVATGALPNGRFAGTSLADGSASPQQGADVCGPTATMNSVAKLDPMYMEGPLLNMKFSPAMLVGTDAKRKFADLIATYFDQGANQVQFNILDRKTLLEAQRHPDQYRNLVVRVAGYSAFFVELTSAVQDEIISRTEQSL